MTKDQIDNLIIDILIHVSLESKYDIPYLAGYSVDGKKIYIDKDCPWFFGVYPVYKLLLIHEYTEKIEIDKGFNYQLSHEKATKTERIIAETWGMNWKEYDQFMQAHVKNAINKKLQSIPYDLDLTPYLDMKDYEQITKINRVNHGTNSSR